MANKAMVVTCVRLFQKDLKLHTRVCSVKIQPNADINLFIAVASIADKSALQRLSTINTIRKAIEKRGLRRHDVRSPFLQPHPFLLTDTQFTCTVQLTFYEGALFSTGAGRGAKLQSKVALKTPPRMQDRC